MSESNNRDALCVALMSESQKLESLPCYSVAVFGMCFVESKSIIILKM